MSKEIKFQIKLTVDGKEQLQTVTTDARQLRKAMNEAKTSAQRFTDAFINFNQGVEYVRNLADAFSFLDDKLNRNRDVSVLTGLQGEDMEKLRNGVEAVAEYFGKDFNEVLRSVNSLSKGFGISMDEALRLVRDGMVSGADAGGDFLDTLREYPRYFKEAGLSAEDFVAITANAAKQGVFSDKGVDVIKEGNLRIREMTKATADALNGIGISADLVQQQLRDGSTTTFEVMQQVAAKLRELPPSASQVGTAIADIFGGPGEDAGLEYIKTLADVKLSMDDVKAATNGVAEQQEQQIARQEELKNGLLGLIDLSGVYAKMKPYVDTAAQIGFAVSGVVSLANALKIANVQAALAKARMLALNAAALATGAGLKRTAAMTRVFSAALRTGAYSATAMQMAVRGLLVATGVGAAIAGLTWAIGKLTEAGEDAGDAAEEAGGKIEGMAESHDAYVQRAAEVQTQLDRERDKLGQLIKAGGDTAAMVNHLNSTYGDAFGTYRTAAQWYDTLTKKSRTYAAAMGYEAAAANLRMQANTQQAKVDVLNSQIADLYKSGGAMTKQWDGNVTTVGGVSKPQYRYVKSDTLKALEKERNDALKAGRQYYRESMASERRYQQELAKVKAENPGDTHTGTPKLGKGSATTHARTALEGTVKWYGEQIASLEKTREETLTKNDEAEAGRIQAKIDEYKAAKLELERTLGITAASTLTGDGPAAPDVKDMAKALDVAAVPGTPIAAADFDTQPLDDYGEAAESLKHKLLEGWGGLKDVVGGIGSLAATLEGDADAWTKFTAVVDTAIGMANGIGGIMGLFAGGAQGAASTAAAAGAATTAMGAMTAAEAATTAASAPLIAANKLVAASFMEIAAAAYYAAHAYIPFTGFAIASGFVASAKAAVLAVAATPFADGGVVSGPTLALVGEYAGASNNPEVIAPLDKLRSMLQPQGAVIGGVVRFELDGRKLVGVLANETRVSSKSGKRTNIRI